MASFEFGLPIHPGVGGRSQLVRDVSGLQPYIDFLVDRFGVGFERSCSLTDLVGALRGWDWAPARTDCPVGALHYLGSDTLPECATVDPRAATTAARAPAVDVAALPPWQQDMWASRPLSAALFDRLSVDDVDRDFLLGVVQNGVLLVPDAEALAPYALPNYQSAYAAAADVSSVVLDEVAAGWVTAVDTPPAFVHPLGAVPKSDGGFRVIHDHSVPVGASVNDNEVYVRYTWDSLDLAVRHLVPHVFMARLDISAYYRHFMVHPSQWHLQGFEWQGVHYVDSRVQFGLRLAPELAHRFTMFIKRVLHANGVCAVVGVMDDYLLLHCDYRACLVMLAVAAALLADLGFKVNFKPGKTMPPARVQKFVGVIINSARFTLSLPRDKLDGLLQDIRLALQRRTVPRKLLQRVVGKMQWASRVIFGARVFMRSCLDGLSTVLHPGHHVSVTSHMKGDLLWWLHHAGRFNGLMSLSPRLLTHFVYTDACLSPEPCVGVFCAGAFLSLTRTQLLSSGFSPPAVDADINVWECYAIFVAVALLGAWWQGSQVTVLCDNSATVAWVGKGSPRPLEARALVQELFAACLDCHLRLHVQHLPGDQNVLADALSRQQWSRFGLLAQSVLGVSSPFLSGALPVTQGS